MSLDSRSNIVSTCRAQGLCKVTRALSDFLYRRSIDHCKTSSSSIVQRARGIERATRYLFFLNIAAAPLV
jgi:hypothetical protein